MNTVAKGETVRERGEWAPRTRLGQMIREGRITSIEEIFSDGWKIKEPEIVNSLIPDLQEEVININLVQKQTDAGEKSRFKAIVAVGNRDGYVGLGAGKAKQVRTAIEKAALAARLNITPVKRGCGSWECGCGKPHSLQFQIRGKCGSVEIVLIPGPRGLGIVAGEVAKVIFFLLELRTAGQEAMALRELFRLSRTRFFLLCAKPILWLRLWTGQDRLGEINAARRSTKMFGGCSCPQCHRRHERSERHVKNASHNPNKSRYTNR